MTYMSSPRRYISSQATLACNQICEQDIVVSAIVSAVFVLQQTVHLMTNLRKRAVDTAIVIS